ncbi:MAG: phosphoribosyltransferase [Bdellovibrionota bacterium]
MIFKNREEAAELLSKKLGRYKNQNAVVFAIPRGAILMGRKIAKDLGADFEILFVHKLGSPNNSELAMGAIGESGEIYGLEGQSALNKKFLKEEAARQLQNLKNKKREYSLFNSQPAKRLEQATAILIDDGMATGATVEAGLFEIKKRKPKKILLAVPVASRSAMQRVQSLVDEIIVLDQPEDFWAVGQFYENFPEVNDNEIKNILRKDAHESLL